jgi:hypothetical protein
MSDQLRAWLADALASFTHPVGPGPVRDLGVVLADGVERERFLRELRYSVWQRSEGRVSLAVVDAREFTAFPKDLLAVPLRLTGTRRVALVPADQPLQYD